MSVERGDGTDVGKGGALRTVGIILVASLCGWLVMEMEILGARILAPYFGSAIYVVMGSVIGVFLLSLSIGYMLGGWLSKTRHSKRILAGCLIAAGIWLFGMMFFVEPVSDALLDAGFDEKWGSLVASLVLFASPTVLLGTVSPTAVRWLTRRAQDSGLNTGLVFAASTVASFVGCVVTAFYLVLLSTRATVWVSAGVLVALGAIILLHSAFAGRPER